MGITLIPTYIERFPDFFLQTFLILLNTTNDWPNNF